MVNPNELRFVCTRCGNCCTDKNTLVNVTYWDILRIVKGLKLDLTESLEIFGFYVFDKNLTSTNLKKMVIPPVKTEKGLAFLSLMKNSQGECYFYDFANKKCLIYDLRPMFCKSFPFTFNPIHDKKESGEESIEILYTEKAKKYCPGISNESPPVDYKYLIKLAKNTLKGLKDHYTFIVQWNKEVTDKKVSPSAKNFLRTIFNMHDD
jgi:Fe-S-cluster containining protein